MPSLKVTTNLLLDASTALQHFNNKSMAFLKAVVETSGLGEETYLPEGAAASASLRMLKAQTLHVDGACSYLAMQSHSRAATCKHATIRAQCSCSKKRLPRLTASGKCVGYHMRPQPALGFEAAQQEAETIVSEVVQTVLDQTGLIARQVCRHLSASWLQTCHATLHHHCQPVCNSDGTKPKDCKATCTCTFKPGALNLVGVWRMHTDSHVMQIKVVIVACGAYK